MSIGAEFVRVSRRELATSFKKIESAAARLPEEEVWGRRNENENSVGNLLLHLEGNVRQWILGGIGGAEDHRRRDSEFAQRDAIPLDELLERLSLTLEEADAVIGSLTEEQLMETRVIQGYELTVLQAVYHVVEHFGGHTGQILWAVKNRTGQDLGFYAHLAGGGKAGGGQP